MNPYVIVQYEKIKDGVNSDILIELRDKKVLLDTLIKKYEGLECDTIKKAELDAIYRDIHRNEVLLSEYYSLTKTIIPNLSLDIHQLEKLKKTIEKCYYSTIDSQPIKKSASTTNTSSGPYSSHSIIINPDVKSSQMSSKSSVPSIISDNNSINSAEDNITSVRDDIGSSSGSLISSSISSGGKRCAYYKRGGSSSSGSLISSSVDSSDSIPVSNSNFKDDRYNVSVDNLELTRGAPPIIMDNTVDNIPFRLEHQVDPMFLQQIDKITSESSSLIQSSEMGDSGSEMGDSGSEMGDSGSEMGDSGREQDGESDDDIASVTGVDNMDIMAGVDKYYIGELNAIDHKLMVNYYGNYYRYKFGVLDRNIHNIHIDNNIHIMGDESIYQLNLKLLYLYYKRTDNIYDIHSNYLWCGHNYNNVIENLLITIFNSMVNQLGIDTIDKNSIYAYFISIGIKC